VTIRAKLAAAIALTILGPLVTIGVALAAFGTLGERFADVDRAGANQRLALDLKFAVTDVNGWQTAYGYDDGRSRPRFEAAAEETEALLARARRRLTAPDERALLVQLDSELRRFMALDAQAWRALEENRPQETKRILLGPELEHFARMARIAGELADVELGAAAGAATEFDDARDDARRQLVAVAIGAGVVIILLLLTAQDVVRLALERRDPA
jgi:hypothetical protein